MTEKLYEKRDARKQGQWFIKHMNAMTYEKLHGKFEIAKELAHRDIEIERLKQLLEDAVIARRTDLYLVFDSELLGALAEISVTGRCYSSYFASYFSTELPEKIDLNELIDLLKTNRCCPSIGAFKLISELKNGVIE